MARLARLRLGDEELERFARELSQILEHVGRIAQLDLADVEPSAGIPAGPSGGAAATPASGGGVELRPDEPRPGLSREEALHGAPRAHDGLFAVPRILGEG